ncbi:hypothetical protein AUR66_20060 [Haloferax profundi]|uniref:Uncharacterized protein n=1 Tax=Haloferax profundi TaxID=1544718 RepID=A0A0W1RD59_9EURY|nr:hypothetical protein AUR66_20060 [Haloferax profundi]
MRSKRELIGDGPPFDGLHWSEFQWNRILAIFSGIGATVLYFWVDLSMYLPEWTAAALSSVPIGLLLYGFSEQSWRTTSRITVGTGIGLGLGAGLNSLGICVLC